MKKIIVTGGLGFIGSNLIELLLKKNLLQVTGKEAKRKMKEVENIEFLKMEKYLKKLE